MRASNVYRVLRHRGLRAFVRACVAVLRIFVGRWLTGRRYVKCKVYEHSMYVDLQDPGISRTLLLFGEREIDHKIILERVLRPGMAVLDIGANMGYYALMELRLIGSQGRLVAVEPSPDNLRVLRMNVELSGNDEVAVIQGAVSNRSGSREFFLSSQSNLNTFHDTGTGKAHLTGETIEVRTLTVGEIADTFGPPDLIRMDVEGHEVEIIEGMIGWLRAETARPLIVFETHSSRYGADHDMAAVLRKAFDLGYQVALLASSFEAGSSKIEEYGYRAVVGPIATDDVQRKIFADIEDEDAVEFICRAGARTVLLESRAS